MGLAFPASAKSTALRTACIASRIQLLLCSCNFGFLLRCSVYCRVKSKVLTHRRTIFCYANSLLLILLCRRLLWSCGWSSKAFGSRFSLHSLHRPAVPGLVSSSVKSGGQVVYDECESSLNNIYLSCRSSNLHGWLDGPGPCRCWGSIGRDLGTVVVTISPILQSYPYR